MVNTKLNLSMTEPYVRRIYAKQGDTGRVLEIELDDYPLENGDLRILRPDGVQAVTSMTWGGEVEPIDGVADFVTIDNGEVSTLDMSFTHKQNLNGYDAPWAKGAGRNKLRLPTYAEIQDAPIYNSYRAIPLQLEPNSTYYLSGSYINGYDPYGKNKYVLISTSEQNNTTFKAIVHSSNQSMQSGTITSDENGHLYIKINPSAISESDWNTIVDGVKAQLELGSSSTSWQPYSNICPIYGETEATIYVRSNNLWDEEWELGSFNTTTGANVTGSQQIRAKNYIPIIGGKTYFVSSPRYVWMIFFDSSKNVINPPSGTYATSGKSIGVGASPYSATFTAPPDCAYIRFYCQTGYGTTYNNDIAINYPSTVTTYAPYNGTEYTIDLEHTVYGGTLDAVEGKLTITHAFVTLDGSETYSAYTAHKGFYYTASGIKSGTYKQYWSDSFKALTSATINDIGIAWGLDSSERIYFLHITDNIGGITDVASWKTWLASNNVQLLYELATPIEVSIEPIEIETLIGQNYVWVVGGSISDLVYTYDDSYAYLSQEQTSVVGECLGDMYFNGASTMPFTLVVKPNNKENA